MTTHAGTIALIGRPNAGKSTLLNQLLGQKLAITSNKPQTTRNRVLGILHAPDLQAVLVDTPGIHQAKGPMNRAMVQAATSAITEVDAICWVLDVKPMVGHNPTLLGHGNEQVAQVLEPLEGIPLTLALNKMDLVGRDQVLPVVAMLASRFPAAEVVPLSALKGRNTERLLEIWKGQLPEGEPLYPADQFTDSPERFVVAELVREKLFKLTKREVPYALAVEIERFDEEPANGEHRGRVQIYAKIYVEREGQKRIVVGKGGEILKKVGIAARRDIEALLGTHVHLDLHVTVREDWTSDPRMLRDLGIG